MARKIITTQPLVEAVSTADAKAYLNVTHSADDSLIASLITAARIAIERLCNRSFIHTVWTRRLDCFPDVIRLTPLPLDSVASISYIDASGNPQTLTEVEDYRVSDASDDDPPRITPALGRSWPSTLNVTDAVSVVYKVGYGASDSDVPEPIKTAIKMLAANVYDAGRAPVLVGGAIAQVPWTIDAMLDPYKVPSSFGSLV